MLEYINLNGYLLSTYFLSTKNYSRPFTCIISCSLNKLVRKVLQIGKWRLVDVGYHDQGHTAESGLRLKSSHWIIVNLASLPPTVVFIFGAMGKL